MEKKLFELIESFAVITIFHHVNADGDALGSQYGLYFWIKETYPNKEVYALGDNISSLAHLFPRHDLVDDEVIAESLALILDTSIAERINDKRALQAKVRFRLDHHFDSEQFTDYEIVRPEISSTCQLLATILHNRTKRALSPTVSRYLYYGMLTDTVSFSIESVNAETLRTAAYLLESGISAAEINRELFTVSRKVYQFQTYVSSHVEFRNNVAYVKLTQEIIRQHGISSNEAKECITLLNYITGINVWCLFVEDEKKKDIYNVSLRAYRIQINEIAAKYGGGGHKYAAGIKGLSEAQLRLLLEDLQEVSQLTGS